MSEWRLFDVEATPEWTTPEWYAEREAAPHLEQEGHRERLLLTADFALEARLNGAGTLSDLGAGDGGLLSLVNHAYSRVWGYDLQQTNVSAAKSRGVDITLADVLNDPWVVYGECVVATEFLEHIVDPHGLVAALAEEPGVDYLIASSPYTETDQSHYAFHLWAWDQDGYRALLESNGWRVVKTGLAWISQVVLAVKA